MNDSPQSYASAYLRVDLLGGTLDIDPIHLILKDTVTLNLALSLTSSCQVSSNNDSMLRIISKDYSQNYEFPLKSLHDDSNFYDHSGVFSHHYYKEMILVAAICRFFISSNNHNVGVDLTLSSGSPAGAGLGGSSVMGIAVYKALCSHYSVDYRPDECIRIVKRIESQVLACAVTGYQDYYPAVYGGVLALHPSLSADLARVEQIYSTDFVSTLGSRCKLIYSGQSRLSGINNWKVYQSFFNGDRHIRKAFAKIAQISQKAYKSMLVGDQHQFFSCLLSEGELRQECFTGFQTKEMTKVATKSSAMGVKVCGAGGGGCFLLIFDPKKLPEEKAFAKLLSECGMTQLPLDVACPQQSKSNQSTSSIKDFR